MQLQRQVAPLASLPTLRKPRRVGHPLHGTVSKRQNQNRKVEGWATRPSRSWQRFVLRPGYAKVCELPRRSTNSSVSLQEKQLMPNLTLGTIIAERVLDSPSAKK